jgi:hypothetical protein
VSPKQASVAQISSPNIIHSHFSEIRFQTHNVTWTDKKEYVELLGVVLHSLVHCRCGFGFTAAHYCLHRDEKNITFRSIGEQSVLDIFVDAQGRLGVVRKVDASKTSIEMVRLFSLMLVFCFYSNLFVHIALSMS